MKKRSLIIDLSNGAYLSKLLLKKKHEIVVTSRSKKNFQELQKIKHFKESFF